MGHRRRRRQVAGELECFARCAGGFEVVLGKELRGIGLHRVRPQVGGAIFFGTLEDAYRACLWSRVATRIQLVLTRVPAADADDLYEGVRAFAWEEHVPEGATIAVDAHGENPQLRNTKFTALKVKDALCDRLRDVRGSRPDVAPHDPDVAVNVALHPKKATIYLNLSGASLHRRGYRAEGVQTEAPLKETLAAGILLAAGWPDLAAAGGVLVDPMCGSGTFAIEGAQMAADIAPGLLRARWGFEGWAGHDADAWERVLVQARARREVSVTRPCVIAGDLDPAAIAIAQDNAARAGVERLVRFHVDDAARIKRHMRGVRGLDGAGLLVANPPYGLRLLTHKDLPRVNEALAMAVEALPTGWTVALITPDTGVDTALGRVPDEVIACHNGPLETFVRIYQTKEEARKTQEVISLAGKRCVVPVAEENSAQFAARLRKVGKERLRWARRSGIGCFRVYDADLPDYALSVDLYLGAGVDEGQRYAVVEERQRPKKVDDQRAARRFADAIGLVAAVLDVPPAQVIARPWREARSDARGRAGQARRVPLCVEEAGLCFGLDLEGRPDTGLPLVLRDVRTLVARTATQRCVAVLGASAVASAPFAASAGARSVVTVDAYPDRIAFVRQAFAENGLSEQDCQFVCEDLRTWLEQESRGGRRYELVVCALPEWMPPRQGGGGDWQLQRDHQELLRALAALLAPSGMLVCSYLSRDTVFDAAAFAAVGLAGEDVRAQTIPLDLKKAERRYHCWVAQRVAPRS